MNDSTETGDRIAKVMARAGVASRRDAERMIVEGRVAVNGKVIKSPALDVAPGDKVTLDGKPIDAPQPARLWLYYKPLGLVTSERDEKGRQTVFDTMPEDMPRVMSVGRLDLNSEGLLLLTNDGGLKRQLELPSTGWLRKYRVRVNGRPSEATFDPLKRGITIEGEEFQPMDITLDRQQGANAWLTVGLREGKNREIRRAMSEVGLVVNRLIRVSYGPFRLNKMEPGAIVEVKQKVLKEQLGGAWAAEEAPVGRARPARADGVGKPRAGSSGGKPRAARSGDGGFERAPRTGPRDSAGYERKPRDGAPAGAHAAGTFERKPRPPRDEDKGNFGRAGRPEGAFERRPHPPKGDVDRKPRAPRGDGSFERKPYVARDSEAGKPRAPRGQGGFDRKAPAPKDDTAGFDRKPRPARDAGDRYDARPARAKGDYDRKSRPPREGEGTFDRKPRAPKAEGGYERKPYAQRADATGERTPRPPREAGEGYSPKPRAGFDAGHHRKPRAPKAEGGSERKPYAPRADATGERTPRPPREAGEGHERKPRPQRDAGSGGKSFGAGSGGKPFAARGGKPAGKPAFDRSPKGGARPSSDKRPAGRPGGGKRPPKP